MLPDHSNIYSREKIEEKKNIVESFNVKVNNPMYVSITYPLQTFIYSTQP